MFIVFEIVMKTLQLTKDQILVKHYCYVRNVTYYAYDE